MSNPIKSVHEGMPEPKAVENNRDWTISVSDGTKTMSVHGLDIMFRRKEEVRPRHVEMVSITTSSPDNPVTDREGDEVTPEMIRNKLGLQRFIDDPTLASTYIIEFDNGGAHISRGIFLCGIKTNRTGGRGRPCVTLEWEK